MKADNIIQRASLPDEGFVRLPQVLEVYPVSKSTWWAGIGTRFPEPIKLGPRTTVCRVEYIRKLIQTTGGQYD